MKNERCCGTCRFHRNARIANDEKAWLCSNVDSDCCGAVTGYEDGCFDWREKNEHDYTFRATGK